MWIATGEQATELTSDDKLRLLEYHQRAEWNALDKYGQHLNIQAALLSALVAGGVIALVIDSLAAKFMVLLVPLAMAFLRKHTTETLDRYYRRFLEAAACSRKLEWLLGLDRPINAVDQGSKRRLVFPGDKHLDVARRWGGLLYEKATSAEWVTDLMCKGHNGVARRLMRFIFATTLFIPPASWLVAAATEASWNLSTQWLLAMACCVAGIELLSLVLYLTHSRGIRRDREVEQSVPTPEPATAEHSNA